MKLLTLLLAAPSLLLWSGMAHAQEQEGAEASTGHRLLRLLDNEYYKIDISLRPRVGLADQDGRKNSQAYTLRSRVGIGNKPLYGFRVFGEMESNVTPASSRYFNVTGRNNGRTAIADPQFIELNRAFLEYRNDEFLDVLARGGRQRVIYDDSRFIGNVGWRQNEQTFDAARGGSSFGISDFLAEYSYLWEIHRIFADKGGQATRDWDSKSHLVHATYTGLECLDITAFAYFLDFESSSPGNSSNSYGFRLKGAYPLSENWKLGYVGSYARQTDAGKNPEDYDANYAWGSASIGYQPIGTIEAGYELLGSDDGRARFVTPLSTAHKFNGFADAFLDNGGVNGLQDFFVSAAPALPWKLKGKVIYHRFWSDENGTHLGDEIDAVVTRKFGKYLTFLTKAAWFDGSSKGPADRWRFTAELSFDF